MPKPAPLRPGDTIAVVAPASTPPDPERLRAGLQYLRDLGYQVEVGRETWTPRGYLAGPDAERLDEFNRFLRRPDVKALFCARGGFGALRLLPSLDYAAARAHPKLLVGYSDITALHLAFNHTAGWTGLSGPMVAPEWGVMEAPVEQQFWTLAQGGLLDPLLGPNDEHLRAVRPGTAEGILLGGNLTLITRLLGTPYLPPLDGALLFIEEVGEEPYRLDGLFAHLRLAGVLDRLGGLIIGALTDWEPKEPRPTLIPEEVLADYLSDAPFPVAAGLVYGHFPAKSTMPIGTRARLVVTDSTATLSMLEPVVG